MIDVGDEKISIEIPKSIKDSRKIVLNGLGKENPKTKKKGNLILNITIKSSNIEKIELNNNKIDYDYVLFVSEEELTEETQKILKIENNKKLIIPIDSNISNREIIDYKIKNISKKILIISIQSKEEANLLNSKFYQSKVIVKKSETEKGTYQIVKYKNKEIPIKIPSTNKTNFILLAKNDDNKYFKVYVEEKSIKRLFKSIIPS